MTAQLKHGPRLQHASLLSVGRVIWIVLAGSALALYLGSLPASYIRWSTVYASTPCLIPCGQLVPAEAQALHAVGISPQAFAAYNVLLVTLLGVIPFAIGLLIFLRRPDQLSTLFFSLMLALIGFMVPPVFDAGMEVHPAWTLPVVLLKAMGRGSILVSLYLFPDGRFVPRGTRALTLLLAAMFLAMVLAPGLPGNLIHEATMYGTFRPSTLLLAAGWLGSGVAAQVYRYTRVSGPLERQQTKWVIYGWAAGFVGFVGYVAPYFFVPTLMTPSRTRILYFLTALPFFQVSVVLIPVFAALAILRFKLWEIDQLINRSLVYASLTAALALLYAAGVVLFQRVLRVESSAGIVVTTLGVAALFTPLRTRIQRAIDRRFYRRKYDAERTLAEFGSRLRERVEIVELTNELLAAVGETVEPAFATLWLATNTSRPRTAQPHVRREELQDPGGGKLRAPRGRG